jgi:hypothetical protein
MAEYGGNSSSLFPLIQFPQRLVNTSFRHLHCVIDRNIYRRPGRAVVKFDLAFFQFLRPDPDLEREADEVGVVQFHAGAFIPVII